MRDELDIGSVDKSMPLKSIKLSSRAAEIQHPDVNEISQLDPSNSNKYVDYLSQSEKIQTEMAREIRETETLDSMERMQRFQEAKNSFMAMMEIRNVLVDAYEEIHRMRTSV